MTLKKLVGLSTVFLVLIMTLMASSVLASSEGVCSINIDDSFLRVSDLIVGEGENATCTSTVSSDGVLAGVKVMTQNGLFYNSSFAYDSSKVYDVSISCVKDSSYFESSCGSEDGKSYAGAFFISVIIIGLIVLLAWFLNVFGLEKSVATFIFWVLAFGLVFVCANISIKLLSNTVLFGSALLLFKIVKNVSLVAFFGSVLFALWYGIKRAREWLISRK